MTTGPRMTERSTTAPASMTTLPSIRDSASTDAVDAPLDRVEDQPVGLEHVLELAGVLPPAVDEVRPHLEAAVDQVLDGVGDLELVAEARLDALHRVEDRRREHVDADQREIALRLLRLLDQPDDPAVGQLGDAEHLRIRHPRQQDLRGGPSRANSSTNSVIPLFRRLSPRYITNGSRPMNGSLISTACASPRGASCSM